MRKPVCALVLGLSLIMSAHAQPPSGGPGQGPAATTFVVKFKVKPGRNADFEKAFADMAAGVRDKEPGNIYYELYHEAGDPQTYVIVEHYKDAQAVSAHGRTEHAKKLIAAVKDLTEGPADADLLVFVTSK
jgi:quinol monooxygenase YgiN